MYEDLDFLPVEHELVGVTSEEFKSGELSGSAFDKDSRWMQADCSNKETFSMRTSIIS